METERLIENGSGTGVTPSYFIDNDSIENEVQLFINFVGGTVTIEASADGSNFAPLKNGTLSASEVVPVDLAEGSYLRLNYAGVTSGLTVWVKPKKQRND